MSTYWSKLLITLIIDNYLGYTVDNIYECIWVYSLGWKGAWQTSGWSILTALHVVKWSIDVGSAGCIHMSKLLSNEQPMSKLICRRSLYAASLDVFPIYCFKTLFSLSIVLSQFVLSKDFQNPLFSYFWFSVLLDLKDFRDIGFR